MTLRFESIPAYYAACGIRGITRVTLDHLFQTVAFDFEAFNRLLANPARLFEATFPTGGRLGARANEISKSFHERKAILALWPHWVATPAVEEDHVDLPATATVYFGRSYCLTGAGPKPRAELEAFIRALGGIVHSSVTSKTDYLVMADKNSASSKAKKAAAAGTTLLDYKEVF